MGPRLRSRGSRLREACGVFERAALQWGRGFAAAEVRKAVELSRLTGVLQWGRGFAAAEVTTQGDGP